MEPEQLSCDQELLERLSGAKPEEIDGLVDVITDFGKGRAGLDTRHKKSLVLARYDSKKNRYDRTILTLVANELQSFGGHSAVNAARRLFGRSGVSYEEIVDDVFKKLNGIDAGTKSCSQKEREIALALLGDNWKELSMRERFEKSTSTKVLTGNFFIEKTLSGKARGAASGILNTKKTSIAAVASYGLRLNPIGAALAAGVGINNALTEAYRVTIPFVSQMGCISFRKKSDIDRPLWPTQTRKSLQRNEITPLQELVLADECGNTLMSINLFDQKPETLGSSLTEQQIDTLNPLISSLPGLASLTEMQKGNYVICSLPYDALTKAKNSDSMRAWVTEASRIKEHAHLSQPQKLQSIMVSGAVWNVVSTVVAQKHLHDINDKLNTISQQLDDIKQELEGERKNKLASLVHYAQGVLDHLSVEGVDPNVQGHLELRLVDLYELEVYFKEKLAKEEAFAKELEVGSLFGSDDERRKLFDSLNRMERWTTSYLQVAQLIVVTCALLYTANPRERYTKEAFRAMGNASSFHIATAVYSAQLAMSDSLLFSTKKNLKSEFVKKIEYINTQVYDARMDSSRLYSSFFSKSDRRVLLEFENGKPVAGHLLT